MKKIKVHVADDHKILIEGIIAVVKTDKEIEIEGYSLTGEEVINWSKSNEADILILDINMPIFDGIDVLKKLREDNKKINVIVLSSYDDTKFVQEVLELGAKGFVNKGSAGEHIVKAIKAVHSGKQYFSDQIRDNLLEAFTGHDSKEGDKPESSLVKSLTDREIEVLKLIVKEHSTLEISDLLHISKNTVETYRKSLLKKTRTKNAVGLAVFAVNNNLISP